MIDQLKEQVQIVARLRAEAQLASDCVAMSRKAWEADHVLMIAEAKDKAEQTKQAEECLRKLTLEVYEQTKDKKPAEGVGIREVTELTFEQSKAFEWAKSHNLALKLDEKAFDKIAMSQIIEDKTGKLTMPEELAFVIAKKVATATIATKLEVRE